MGFLITQVQYINGKSGNGSSGQLSTMEAGPHWKLGRIKMLSVNTLLGLQR